MNNNIFFKLRYSPDTIRTDEGHIYLNIITIIPPSRKIIENQVKSLSLQSAGLKDLFFK